jgi:hypothetical protein
MIKFFLHYRIFYRYNFTHASPILCSKSLHLHLYFLGSHLYIYKWFLFVILRLIKYNIIFTSINCANNTRPSHYHISHYIFYLTFRGYCGINLLLGHQYGSHYLYLNLKSNVVNCSSVTCILGLPTSPFLSAVQTARS